MTEITLQVLITLLAGLFSGITLFLASVLRRTFEDLTEAEYYVVFTRIIRYGRRSLLIYVVIAVPSLALMVYLAAYGLSDLLFIVGGLSYVIGSLGLSLSFNEPTYTRLLAASRTDNEAIVRLRRRVNNGNIARATVSTTGVLLMGLALIT